MLKSTLVLKKHGVSFSWEERIEDEIISQKANIPYEMAHRLFHHLKDLYEPAKKEQYSDNVVPFNKND